MGSADKPISVGYILLPGENLDNTSMGRNWAEKVIRNLRNHDMQWGLLTNGERWRIYHQDEPTPYETYLEINLAAILADRAREAYQIFHKFLRAENFAAQEDGRSQFDVFKKASQDKIDYIEKELENALKQKEEGGQGVLSSICMSYVKYLRENGDPDLDDETLRRKIYHGAMLYMFRLLFLYYADARGLLSDENHYMLADVRQAAYDMVHSGNPPEKSYRLWQGLEKIFVDIDQTYNGGLFNPYESEFTLFIEESRIADSYLAPAVYHLAYYHEKSGDEKPISYRDMSVRHLGTLYEGLLEHKLFIAEEDIEVRISKDHIQFIPLSQGGILVAGQYIQQGNVYFGSDSRERKATGSYYTPEYIVDYIVNETLGKIIQDLRASFLNEHQDLIVTYTNAVDDKEQDAIAHLIQVELLDFVNMKVLDLSTLDPAMGSGHFLVNATILISNFITDFLNEFSVRVETDSATRYWRRRVVENCIYGVDVNPLAVELSKLSLWILAMAKDQPLSFLNHHLKCGNSLLGATLDEIGKYPRPEHQKDNRQISYFENNTDFNAKIRDAIKRYRGIADKSSTTRYDIILKRDWLEEIDELLKPYRHICNLHLNTAFDQVLDEFGYLKALESNHIEASLTNNRRRYFHWELEFPEVLISKSGFDCAVGNPPYIKEYVNRHSFVEFRQSHLRRYYQGKMDIWYVFACLSIDLLRKNGRHSMIAINNWITNTGASILRKKIFSETQMHEFVDFCNYFVFNNASVQTMIYSLEKSGKRHMGYINYRYIKDSNIDEQDVISFLFEDEYDGYADSFQAAGPQEFNGEVFTFVGQRKEQILRKIYESANYFLRSKDVGQGIVIPQDFVQSRHLDSLGTESVKQGDGIFVLTHYEKNSLELTPEEDAILKPYFTTAEIQRYYTDPINEYWIIYTDTKTIKRINSLPSIASHLDRFADVITSDNRPYGLHRARNEKLFLGEKILSLRKTNIPYFSYNDFPCYVSQTFFIIQPSDINLKYLVGLLNSRLCHFWLNNKGKKQGNALQVDKGPLLAIPIIKPDSSDQRSYHEQIITLVNKIISTNTQVVYDQPNLKGPSDLQHQVEKEINHIIYKLYRLKDDDIHFIESSVREQHPID